MWTLVLCILMTASCACAEGPEDGTLALFDFDKESKPGEWIVVNDGVMGGDSQGTMVLSAEKTGLFSGKVSLEGNGGFVSMHSKPKLRDLGLYDGLLLRAKGDGRLYNVTIRLDERVNGVVYQAPVQSLKDKWIEMKVPFRAFVPTWRGMKLNGAAPIDPFRIQSIGLIISDKKAGPFRIELDWVSAYKTLPHEE